MPHPAAYIVNSTCPVLTIDPHSGWFILTAVLIDGTVIMGAGVQIEEALVMLHTDYDKNYGPYLPKPPHKLFT